ncbi:MAG: hypothetical protein IBJ03_17575 [Gemmatimonadaceae bacterium]|nr:hypothetical protein [Gemmatimonadaceae bacterium]
MARRRLAALAATNSRIQEALAPSGFPGLTPPASARQERSEPVIGSTTAALAEQLDTLAHDIIATPGAGGALLAAYAAQARALSMVVEAAKRAGSAPLPAAVITAAQEALSSPFPMPGLRAG